MISQPRSEKSHNTYPLRHVFVGLSGGVDSAVSAALLKKQGYEVTGVFIKAWTPPGYLCTWREDRRSAMRVAAVLDIPFITLDLEKEYKKEVVDYMLKEYKQGKTPNPDVMCNKEIKFGHFLDFALKNGADFVATGHYSRVLTSPDSRRGRDEVRVRLMEAKDKNKDQSYFLWTLKQGQLKHILFPIGHLQKNEVRELAERFGLPQATRKDSQGLCFLGQIDMKEFLKENIKTKKGNVLNGSGEVIGEHDGAILYTLGERHGFRVFNQQPKSEPLYVVAKNIDKNTITVSTQNAKQETQNEQFKIQNINWTTHSPKMENECRIRYRGEKIKCKIENEKVLFDGPQLIASGQSVVFYDGEKVLGGAIIA